MLKLQELTDLERQIVIDGLFLAAERYVEVGRSHLKFDGHPKKGYKDLVQHYFRKADVLSKASTLI